MNALGLGLLAALIAHYLLVQVARALNLRALDGELPTELRPLFPPERLEKVRAQAHAQARLSWLSATLELLLLAGFWLGGGFQMLDVWVRGWNLGPIPSGLVFIGLIVLAKALFELPFAIWDTFVIEQRFGFNRTTPAIFAADLFKSLALAVAIGVPVLGVLLYLFEAKGDLAWAWAWGAITAASLALQVVLPGWILPLFNKYENLPDGELRRSIEGYAARVGFALRGIYVMDGSRRSSRANAFFVGIGKNRRIALYDTLVGSLSQPELLAVLAHEVGHFKRRHIPKLLGLGILHTGVLLFLMGEFVREPAIFQAFGVGQPSVYAGLVFFALLYSPIEMVLGPAMHALERRYEFEADAFAARTTGSSDAMASALSKLGVDNLVHPSPHPLYVALHHSHPPLLARLRALAAG